MFSDHQSVTEVSVSTLSRQASAVIEKVVAGERVIVSKHGRPAALIVSISDGIDVMLAGSERFALLRREARESLEAGTGEGVVLAPRASAALAALPRQRRRMLERELFAFSKRGPVEGLASVRTPRDLAACEVGAVGGRVVVYGVCPLAELRASLFGQTLEHELGRRHLAALMHGRHWRDGV